MKNEMELMRMDERQRLAWFMANRGTVIAVGAVWIGMIGWELTHDRVPTFLLVMVPVFALLRAGLYFFYSSTAFVSTASVREPKWTRYGKVAAAILLVGAIAFPLYNVHDGSGDGIRSVYAWNLVRSDYVSIIPLAFMYMWPVLIMGLSRLESRRPLQTLIQFVEPVLAVLSCVIALWIPLIIWETRTLFFIILVPVEPNPDWGCYLPVAANGIYLVSWLAGLLRPWGVQEG